jgi:hypothetical protein
VWQKFVIRGVQASGLWLVYLTTPVPVGFGKDQESLVNMQFHTALLFLVQNWKIMWMSTSLSTNLKLHMKIPSLVFLTRPCGPKQLMKSSCILPCLSLLQVEERIGLNQLLREAAAKKGKAT